MVSAIAYLYVVNSICQKSCKNYFFFCVVWYSYASPNPELYQIRSHPRCVLAAYGKTTIPVKFG